MFEQKNIIGTDVLDHLGLIAATISKMFFTSLWNILLA
jgi:hypothetical protein